MTEGPPHGNWVKIADRADADRHIEAAMTENLLELQRVIDGERDPVLRAVLERNRPRIERQIRDLLEAEMDKAWSAHLKREGKLT